jgi:hypothetical protein
MANQNRLFEFNSVKDYTPWLATSAVVILSIFFLWSFGRVLWCQAADFSPWSGDIWSQHNSQHLFDPYTFTHILHGILEFWLISLIFSRMSLAWRLFLAIFIESGWEVVENTDAVINHYREATLALNYYGDSIINSLGDILACGLGFWLAHKMKFWLSFIFFLLVEIILIILIRDSLLLNIIMLIYPIEGIKQWQIGG